MNAKIVRTATTVFFLVTAGAIFLATYQLVLEFLSPTIQETGPAIGELLLVVVLGAGEILAYFSLVQASKERQFACWLRAQDRWQDAEFCDLRKKMFQRMDNLGQSWTEQGIIDAKNTCRRMDEFARLVPFLGKEFTLDTFDDPIAKAWIVLGPIVDEERTGPARWPRKWECFEKLGKDALAKVISEGRDPRTRMK